MNANQLMKNIKALDKAAKAREQFRLVLKNHNNQVIHIFEGDKKQMKRFLREQVEILSGLLVSETALNITITKE